MKHLALAFLFATIGIISLAQTTLRETIHLKNGTIVTGVIVEYVPNESYTIVTDDGNRFVFEVENIAKISRELEPSENNEPKETNEVKKVKKAPKTDLFSVGYQGIVETGLGAGMGKYGFDIFKLDFINGYRFNKNLYAGGGIGFRNPMGDIDLGFIPITANVRYNLDPNKTVIPMASLSAGVAFNTDDGLGEGGVIVNPAVGIYINKFNSFLLHATFGYDAMHIPFYTINMDNPWNPYPVKKIRFSEAFVVNVGITF